MPAGQRLQKRMEIVQGQPLGVKPWKNLDHCQVLPFRNGSPQMEQPGSHMSMRWCRNRVGTKVQVGSDVKWFAEMSGRLLGIYKWCGFGCCCGQHTHWFSCMSPTPQTMDSLWAKETNMPFSVGITNWSGWHLTEDWYELNWMIRSLIWYSF